jgi:ferritin
MRLSENIRLMLEQQFHHELTNSLIYSQLRAWAEYSGFNNVGEFYKRQSQEERDHAELVFSFVQDKNDVLNVAPYTFDNPGPTFGMGALRGLFEASMATELGTTASLQAIYRAAMDEGDFITSEFMLSMIKIQLEEENTFQSILDRFDRFPASPDMEHLLDLWIGETYNV